MEILPLLPNKASLLPDIVTQTVFNMHTPHPQNTHHKHTRVNNGQVVLLLNLTARLLIADCGATYPLAWPAANPMGGI